MRPQYGLPCKMVQPLRVADGLMAMLEFLTACRSAADAERCCPCCSEVPEEVPVCKREMSRAATGREGKG